MTALYFAGTCMTTATTGDLQPFTPGYRAVILLAAVVGVTTITLMLTYIVQIYNALQRRTTFALALHHATAGTGDAVELLIGLGRGGDFEGARGRIHALARLVQ